MNEVKAHARRSDVETSHEAAATVRVKTDAKQTLDWLGHYSQQFSPVFCLQHLVDARRARKLWPGGWDISESGLRSRVADLRRSGYAEWMVDLYDGQQLYCKFEGSDRRHRLMRLTTKGQVAFENDQEVVIIPAVKKPTERDKILAAVQQAGDERELSETTAAIIRRALAILG